MRISSRVYSIVGVALAVSLGLSTGACDGFAPPATESTSNELIGGAPLEDDSAYPAVVAITMPYGGYCSGVLVDESLVLTAAHCTIGYAASDLTVLFDTYDIEVPVKTVAVQELREHPEYDDNVRDVSLLRLAEPVTDRAPMDLNSYADGVDHFVPGQPVTLVGYGVTEFEGIGGTRLIVEDAGTTSCADLEISPPLSDDELVCHDFSNGGPCNGDSGGPAIIDVNGKSTAISVHSWGVGCEGFAVNTRLADPAVRDFLVATASEWGGDLTSGDLNPTGTSTETATETATGTGTAQDGVGGAGGGPPGGNPSASGDDAGEEGGCSVRPQSGHGASFPWAMTLLGLVVLSRRRIRS